MLTRDERQFILLLPGDGTRFFNWFLQRQIKTKKISVSKRDISCVTWMGQIKIIYCYWRDSAYFHWTRFPNLVKRFSCGFKHKDALKTINAVCFWFLSFATTIWMNRANTFLQWIWNLSFHKRIQRMCKRSPSFMNMIMSVFVFVMSAALKSLFDLHLPWLYSTQEYYLKVYKSGDYLSLYFLVL